MEVLQIGKQYLNETVWLLFTLVDSQLIHNDTLDSSLAKSANISQLFSAISAKHFETTNRVIKRVDHPQLAHSKQSQNSVGESQSVIPCLYKILNKIIFILHSISLKILSPSCWNSKFTQSWKTAVSKCTNLVYDN